MNKIIWMTIATAFVLTGCGKEGDLVEKVKMRTHQVDGDPYLEINTTLNMGSMRIAALSVPYRDPDTGEQLGTITFRNAAGRKAELILDTNLVRAAGSEGYDGQFLPNGTPIPIGGIDDIFSFPAGDGGARVYIGMANGAAVIGAALPFQEFDRIGRSVGGINVFPIYPLDNGILVSAGIYTSTQAGKNGLGIFVDTSEQVEQAMEVLAENSDKNKAAVSQKTGFVSADSAVKKAKAKLRFRTLRASGWAKRKLDYELYKLNRKRVLLHVR